MMPTIDSIIEAAPVSRLQKAIVLTLFLIMLLDGLDQQLLAYAAPVLTQEWRISRLELAPALSATLVGTALGATIGGALADRWGRRIALIGSVTLFGTATFACAFAADIPILTMLRLLSGLGFGACFPGAVALTAEWLPKHAISKATGFIQVGVPAGAMAGALLSGWVIPQFGWRGSFLIGAVPPLLLAAAMWRWLPESPVWLARTGTAPHRLLTLLRKAWGDAPGIDLAAISSPARTIEPGQRMLGGFGKVIRAGGGRTNAAIWLGFFANGLAAYGFWSWATTIMTVSGLSLPDALFGASLFALSGLLATFPAAYVASRAGTRPVMLILALVAIATTGCAALLLPAAGADPNASRPLLYTTMIIAGACLSGMQGLLYVISAHAYPAEFRASGVGLGSTAGRIGGIISAFAGGALLSFLSPSFFFAAVAAAQFGVAVAVLLFDRHHPGQTRKTGTQAAAQ